MDEPHRSTLDGSSTAGSPHPLPPLDRLAVRSTDMAVTACSRVPRLDRRSLPELGSQALLTQAAKEKRTFPSSHMTGMWTGQGENMACEAARAPCGLRKRVCERAGRSSGSNQAVTSIWLASLFYGGT